MRLHFLLALLLLIFTGGSNDFARADQSIKAATRRGIRTPSQVTEGTQRSASVAEDETATIDEERGDPSPLIRSMSHGFEELAETAAATETVSSTSLSSLAMKAPHENPSALAPTDAMSTSVESLVRNEIQRILSALAKEADTTEGASSLSPELSMFKAILENSESEEKLVSFVIALSQRQRAAFEEAFYALTQNLDMGAFMKWAQETPEVRAKVRFDVLKALADLATEADSSTSKKPWVMALNQHPEAKEEIISVAKSLSQRNPEKPEDQAAIIDTVDAISNVPAEVIKSFMNSPMGKKTVSGIVTNALSR